MPLLSLQILKFQMPIMNKSNVYKIKRIIPSEKVKQDVFIAIITFAEAFGYKAKKTDSFAKLKKGNAFTNIYSKKATREIRIDASENEIQIRMYVDLTNRRKDFNSQNPDIVDAEKDIEILTSFINGTRPIPVLPPESKLRQILLNVSWVALLVLISSFVRVYMNDSKIERPSPIVKYDTPKIPFKQSEGVSYKDVDVFLIPIFNFPEIALQYLADDLSKNLGLKVKAVNSMPRQDSEFNQFRNQMPADVYHSALTNLSSRLLSDNPKCIYIAITHDSLYLKNTNMNFVYSAYFDNKHAILGVGQLCVALPEDSASAQKMVSFRIFKMTKRIIGKMYYGFSPSENPQSLMKSPLMTIKDVDDMSMDY